MVSENISAPKVNDYIPQFNDLEHIVTILALAAIYLTHKSNTFFTRKELLEKAHEIEGDVPFFDDTAAEIVLQNCKFLKKTINNQYYLK